MDEKLLENRVHYVFTLLASEDPKFKGVNFLAVFMDYVRAKTPHSSLAGTSQSMKNAARCFVLGRQEESAWKEVISSWYAEDVFEALKYYVDKI